MNNLIIRLSAMSAPLYHEAKKEIERLRSYIENDAYCPCCEATDKCSPYCTYEDDSPKGYAKMMDARKFLGVES
jgi:hypothetical protein